MSSLKYASCNYEFLIVLHSVAYPLLVVKPICYMASFAAFPLQYPRALEEHIPLSHQGAASAFSRGLLVDTNLDTSSPDTYRPPPAPIPFGVTLGTSQTPHVAQGICSDKTNASLDSTNSDSVEETVADNNDGTLTKLEELKESEGKFQSDIENVSAKDSETELPKLAETNNIAEEEDVCPICLEGYVVTASLFNFDCCWF